MNTLKAIKKNIEACAEGKPLMVFDWVKAAQLIKENNAICARAGLKEDWTWTGAVIFMDGKIRPRTPARPFLASPWAVPELELDGVITPCYKMQEQVPEWGAYTYWPEEALSILEGQDKAGTPWPEEALDVLKAQDEAGIYWPEGDS